MQEDGHSLITKDDSSRFMLIRIQTDTGLEDTVWLSMKGGELYTDTTECTLNYNKVCNDCGLSDSDSHEQRPPSGGMIFKLFKINTSNYLLDFYLIVHFEIVYFPRISEQLCRYFDWDNIQRNNNNPANLRKCFTILTAWQVCDHITEYFQVRKSTSRT